MNPYSNNIDELKRRILKGNSKALEDLYRIYFKKLKFYGLQFSEPLKPFGIDDIIQELFIWIAKNHQKLAAIDNLEVYLFTALKKNIYQEISKRERRQQLTNKFFQSTPFNLAEQSVEIKIIESENNSIKSNHVLKLLNSLPPNQKEVIYLRNYVDLSFREIAQIMNLSEQVVRNYSYRAMQKLRTSTANKAKKVKSRQL